MLDFDQGVWNGLIVAATILGPIMAVQVQKWTERWKERRSRKLSLFYQLMATRAARTSAEHVHALNMIDIEFHDSGWMSGPAQRDYDRDVREKWEAYRTHFDHFPEPRPDEDAKQADDAGRWAVLANWNQRGDVLFVDLLHAMSKSLGFGFSRTQVAISYVPQAREHEAKRAALLQQMVVDVLSGRVPLQVELPAKPEDIEEWRALRTELLHFLREHSQSHCQERVGSPAAARRSSTDIGLE